MNILNSSYYKYCIVPQCKSTSIKTPNKLFIYVPNNQQIRNKWLRLARRDDAHCLSTNTRMYFCEDHFDLPNDMENYMQYHVMGSISQVRMKSGCIPLRFECQSDIKQPTTTERSYVHKKQRKALIKEIEIKTSSSEASDPEAVAEDGEAEMEDEVGKVCRACLATGVRMVDVAAGGLQDTFEHVTRTELHTRDERPRQVCYVCCSQLQRFRAFCQMSRQAETCITKLVQRGLQITEQAVSKHRHRLIIPKLDVKKNPLIAIHTQEDPDECVPVEVKVEVKKEVEDNNTSDSETEDETEIGSEVKTGTYLSERDPERENETEEWQPDWEAQGEIKIEIDEVDIEEFDPFEAVEHTTVSDETCHCIQCAEAFPSQSDLLKHMQNHTQQKLEQGNASRENVKAKGTKRSVKSKLASQCKFCNKTFAIQAQLVAHVVMEHGLGESSLAQKPKRRKPNILKKDSKL